MPAEARAERSELYFRSGDARCHAWLYMPDGTSSEARPPIIVMAHGLGAVKALRLSAFAERFQAKGYACLVFDSYDLRHTAASLFVAAGRPVTEVANQLGNSPAVCLARYIHLIEAARGRPIRPVNAWIAEARDSEMRRSP